MFFVSHLAKLMASHKSNCKFKNERILRKHGLEYEHNGMNFNLINSFLSSAMLHVLFWSINLLNWQRVFRYFARAVIDRPIAKNCYTIKPFTVLGVLDLNLDEISLVCCPCLVTIFGRVVDWIIENGIHALFRCLRPIPSNTVSKRAFAASQGVELLVLVST